MSAYAVLAEDTSDAEVLKAIVKRHFNNDGLKIKPKGYGGCGNLCNVGARDIKALVNRGYDRFIVCHDADGRPPREIYQKVMRCVVAPSDRGHSCCIAVPVQEIEAWLIADEEAITHVIPSFTLPVQPYPESIPKPKEWLIRQSRAANGRPRYAYQTFNEKVAQYLRLDLVESKCPSFQEFRTWLRAQ